MTMKVKPRCSQTVVKDTTHRAHPGSFRKSMRSCPAQSRKALASPTEGLSSRSHMIDATATEVATVEANRVR
jgi:hypothetical protein